MINEFEKLCQNRHSVRDFKDAYVSDEDIQFIYKMAQRAPSAGGLKAWSCQVFKDKDTKQKLCEAAYSQKFIEEASVVFVFYSNPRESERKYHSKGWFYSIQDATIACTFAMLTAESIGLSSCWVGAYDDVKVANIIGIELTDHSIISILPIGYMKENFII